jgi:hypothetical protein
LNFYKSGSPSFTAGAWSKGEKIKQRRASLVSKPIPALGKEILMIVFGQIELRHLFYIDIDSSASSLTLN